MRIISPVDNYPECVQLLDAGADELYGGFVPPEWQDYSLTASINQRTFQEAQIRNEKELTKIINAANLRGVSFSLTLNAPFYTQQQIPLLLDFVHRMAALGVNGLILADLGLLRLLSHKYENLKLQASTLAHLSNAGAVRFMIAQGLNRFILPRHLSVADMTAITKQFHDVEFDAFLLVGKCPNTEGLCTFHHSSPEKIWPCEIPYQISALSPSPSQALLSAIERQGSWALTNRRHGCGLCAIPYLKSGGITGLKLVGRGAPSAQKVKNVLLAKKFITLADQSTDFSQYRSQAIKAHQQRFDSNCHQNICYYPEFFDGEII
jgi:putative protease